MKLSEISAAVAIGETEAAPSGHLGAATPFPVTLLAR